MIKLHAKNFLWRYCKDRCEIAWNFTLPVSIVEKINLARIYSTLKRLNKHLFEKVEGKMLAK